MLSVEEIRNIEFSRSVRGYKTEDVDVFLDKVEADYAAFERMIKDYELKVETLNSEIESYKNSQSSIQNVLVSAQSLADRIVKEATEKSENIIKQAENNIKTITAHEKELSNAFELKAQEQKSMLEKELAQMVSDAQKKADLITAAAEERVNHQQMLFDRLKLEIAAFKTSLSNSYKDHIEMLSKLPDSVPADPKYISEVMTASYDKLKEETKKEEKVAEEKTEEPVLETTTESEEPETGFVVEQIVPGEDI